MHVRHFVNTLLVYPVSTSMHSSRMRTARLLPVSPSLHCAGVVSASRGRGGGVCSGGCLLLGCSVCSWGVPAPGRGGVCSRDCLLWGMSAPGECLLRGGCLLGGCLLGGCLLLGGVCLWSWGEGVSQHAMGQTPPSPLWTEWQTGVKT